MSPSNSNVAVHDGLHSRRPAVIAVLLAAARWWRLCLAQAGMTVSTGSWYLAAQHAWLLALPHACLPLPLVRAVSALIDDDLTMHMRASAHGITTVHTLHAYRLVLLCTT